MGTTFTKSTNLFCHRVICIILIGGWLGGGSFVFGTNFENSTEVVLTHYQP